MFACVFQICLDIKNLQNVKAEIIANMSPGYTGEKRPASDLMWVQLQKDVWLI